MSLRLLIILILLVDALSGCSGSTSEPSSPVATVSMASKEIQTVSKSVPQKGKADSKSLLGASRPTLPARVTTKHELFPAGQFLSPLTERVREHLKRLSETTLHLHDDRFIKVGGSGSSTPLLLSCLDRGPIVLGDWEELKPTLTRFRRKLPDGTSPFSRKSLAAKPGGTAQWVLEGNPSPLEQEIEALQPRFALVHYGTNDMHQKGTYESAAQAFNRDMSRLLVTLQDKGIFPIITSITPREDHPKANGWIPFYNHSLRALAQFHALPYLNIHSAILSLPNKGRAEDKLHGNVYRVNSVARPCFFGDEALRYSYNVRNLLTARLLDQLFRLTRGEALPADGAETLKGDGSKTTPWMIPGLPFAHRIDTSRSTQFKRDTYAGCQGIPDVGGPEFEYTITMSETRRVRAFVLADTDVDVDLFLLESTAQTDNCLVRGGRSLSRLLVEGSTYRFVVDTRTFEGSPQWGEATLIIHPCGENDPVCS